jgi:tetratricopeptide (TPR) repeat protein
LLRGKYDRAVADLEQAGREEPALAELTRPRLGEAYLRWSEDLAEDGDRVLAAEKLAHARQLNEPLVDQRLQATPAPSPTAAVERSVAKPVVGEADELLAAGRQHQAAGRYDQALIHYTRALALRADFPEAYLRRGEALLAMGFPDTAIEDLKRASYRSASAEALRLQARAFLQLGSPHRASLAATEALHVDPSHAVAYALRGQAYLALENWERSLKDLQEALRRDPALRPELEPLIAEARRGQERARKQMLHEQQEQSEREATPARAPVAPAA